MIFNSLEFFTFYIIVFWLYWFVFQNSQKLQNVLLLIASYVFYAWWDWRFLSLILFSSLLDFAIGKLMAKADSPTKRKYLLFGSLVSNLGLLGFFKYYNFFAKSFGEAMASLGFECSDITLHIVLPVGISFYTFQTLSYTIDIYRNKITPAKGIVSFLTFVSFFPQLVAGPIERAKHLLPQFEKPRSFSYTAARSGSGLILLGLFKKIVVADGLAQIVDVVYASPHDYTGLPLVIATFFFAFQIYCDFSGYSDIAIGTSRLLGFDLMTNFKQPYFSRSLTEFWRRWHISLSTWFRDYVYIPLGGNKIGSFLSYRNLFITFLISGLWHGANWTFVIWGALHGGVLIIEKALKNVLPKPSLIAQLGGVILTFTIVSAGWVFFRSDSLSDALYIFNYMFSDVNLYSDLNTLSLEFRGIGIKPLDLNIAFSKIVLLVIIEVGLRFSTLRSKILELTFLRRLAYFIILVLIVSNAAKSEAENFIYFQF